MATKQPEAGKQVPVSSHKAFPAIVALWFAALFGIGSLVLPAQLLESIATGTGLSSILSAAEPPLGVAAKIIIALVAAGLGTVIGLWIARKIFSAQQTVPERKRTPSLRAADAHPDAPARRPISALEELGAEKLAEPVPEDEEIAASARRRRVLSLTEESGRSEYLDMAPIPGQPRDEDIQPMPSEDEEIFDFSDHPDMQSDDVEAEVESGEALELDKVAPADEAEPVEALPFAAPVEEATAEFELESEQIFEAEVEDFAEHEIEAEAEPVLSGQFASNVPVSDRPISELGMVELAERLAISIKNHKEKAPIAARAAISDSFFSPSEPEFTPIEVLEEQEFEATLETEDEPQAMPFAMQSLMIDDGDDSDDDDIEDEPFPALNLAPSTSAFAAPAEEDAEEEIEAAAEVDAEPEVTADVEAEATDSAPEIPASWAESANFDKDAHDFGDDEDAQDEGYTSLLAMKSPFLPGQEPVRIEEEDEEVGEIQPMVVFPNAAGQPFAEPDEEDASDSQFQPFASDMARPFDSPGASVSSIPAAIPSAVKADPVETEQALRDALSTLRRMSGAA